MAHVPVPNIVAMVIARAEAIFCSTFSLLNILYKFIVFIYTDKFHHILNWCVNLLFYVILSIISFLVIQVHCIVFITFLLHLLVCVPLLYLHSIYCIQFQMRLTLLTRCTLKCSQ